MAALLRGLARGIFDLATARYRLQRSLSRQASASALEVWADLDPRDIQGSWASNDVGERLFMATTVAQRVSVEAGAEYVPRALAEQGTDAEEEFFVDGDSLAGIASDGRDLDGLLLSPVVSTLTDIRQGMDGDDALARGAAVLDRIVDTQVADAGRAATMVGMVAEPQVVGWVRMINPPACSRCIQLAGQTYLWNQGFERHPKCQCTHIPAAEQNGILDDVRIDPKGYFDSLPKAEQNRIFTAAGAEAIRLGADLNQVVNARRGASGLSQAGRLTEAEQTMLRGGRQRGRLERVDVFGRQLAITTEGVTIRGEAGRRLQERAGTTRGRRYRKARAPRLMPEAILELAEGDRDEARRLLRDFGYIRDR